MTQSMQVVATPEVAPLEMVYESPAAYRVGRIPTTLTQRYGTLRLASGRLSFTRRDGTVQFDVPVSECHSLAKAELGSAIEVWHGATRHRVVMSGSMPNPAPPPGIVDEGILGAAVAADAVIEGIQTQRAMTREQRTWVELLGPLVAPDAPAGVKVRRPFGNFLYVVTTILVVLGITVGILAAIAAAVILSAG